MRALVLVVAAMALFGCEDLDDLAPSTPAAKVAPALRAPAVAATAAAAEKAQHDCRDTCEQTNIVAGGDDDALRACRDRCDARYGAAAAAHEVPSRITVAKPAHAPPAVRPIGAASR